MDNAIIKNRVIRALDELAAREMVGTGQMSTAEKIATAVVDDLFPTLTTEFATMVMANKRWEAGDITTQIVAAALAGETLAGYSPAAWAIWGALLPRVQAFLAQEFTVQLPDGQTLALTIEQAMMREYLREGNA